MRSVFGRRIFGLAWLCLTTTAGGLPTHQASAIELSPTTVDSVATDDESEEAEEQENLGIGSTAPPIDIEHWFSDANGRFEPNPEFESGKVYIVEFWATWCGPCIASMPHLATLQTELADRDVQVISVTYESLEKVETFLDREYKPKPSAKSTHEPATDDDATSEPDEETDSKTETKPSTYRELTSAYCLTADPDASVREDYMVASGRTTIPTAFLVGKSGQIEWIGHPMSLDEPLAAVLDDAWDRDAFKLAYSRELECKQAVRAISIALRTDAPESVLAEIDKALEEFADLEAATGSLRSMREYAVFRNLSEKVQAGDVDQAMSLAKEANLNPRWEDRFEDVLFAHALKVQDYDKAIELLELYIEQSPKDSIRKRLLATMIVDQWEATPELPSDVIDAGLALAEEILDQRPASSLYRFLVARLQRASGDIPAALLNAETALEESGKTSRYAKEIEKFIAEINPDIEAEQGSDQAANTQELETAPE
ncbi:AhpC/TSA family protein [Neorhodopirellula lusitana]|uniref:AhpC/TSA family protein n=1 Tax=Neorhodopirellula lusitana TaxID=445327 RepID=A0ABY1Q9I5_9BACT|nr:redoxin domain-containing protein [Neorhodopirellula lusitana]SMP64353.1 AhpC/TSA family protein [Neorhodopirellula lusitana]